MGFGYYSLEQYNKAIELKKKGFGSQRIAKILGLKKRGAVEDWINKGRKPYYFSEKRIESCNSKENVERMRKMNSLTQPMASKVAAELKTLKLPNTAKILNEDLAYILGVVYGDGHVSVKQRRVILSVIDYDFAYIFKEILERWSGFKIRFFSRKIKNSEYIKSRKLQWVAYMDSIEAAKFLDEFDLNRIINSNIKTKSAFLKGFYDSEGSVAKDGSLYSYNSDLKLIMFVENLLNSMNMETTICSHMGYTPDKSKSSLRYALRIRNKSRQNFLNFVGFNIMRKQKRLINVLYGGSNMIGNTGIKDIESKDMQDNHVVFIANKPFMKSS